MHAYYANTVKHALLVLNIVVMQVCYVHSHTAAAEVLNNCPVAVQDVETGAIIT